MSESSTITLRTGDCLDVFGAEPDASFDAIVADLPSGTAFMSRAWDGSHGHRDKWIAFWAQRLALTRQKCKPGAYGLFWALPRTSGWTHCALEDGGWFVQDVITHVNGQGWPKGRSALKPASEHWILARNGSGGALQIDAARVARGERMMPVAVDKGIANEWGGLHNRGAPEATTLGSWPPNFVMSHCPECEERGVRRVVSGNAKEDRRALGRGMFGPTHHNGVHFGDAGGHETVPAFDCLAACDCGASVLAPAGGEPPRCACGAAMWWACPVAEMDAQSGTLTSGAVAPGTICRASPNLSLSGGNTERVLQVREKDVGGAARFFPRFSPDILAKHDTMSGTQEAPTSCEHVSTAGSDSSRSGENNGSAGTSAAACASPWSADTSAWCASCAPDAGPDSMPLPGTGEGSAPSRARTQLSPLRAQRARFAEIPYASCGTDSAPSSAATPRARCPDAIPGEASTRGRRRPTPCPNRASDADRPEPIGTTTTTRSRRPSSGSALDATQTSIISGYRAVHEFGRIDPPRHKYAAKAAGGERHAGCEHLYWRADKRNPFGFSRATKEVHDAHGNVHPTVKGLDLLRYLARLITPPGGRLGDVTLGSGGSAIAWYLEELARGNAASFLGCDICPEAIEIAEARLAWWRAQSAVQEGLFGEREVMVPEPTKKAAPKPERKPAPVVDERQRDLFGAVA